MIRGMKRIVWLTLAGGWMALSPALWAQPVAAPAPVVAPGAVNPPAVNPAAGKLVTMDFPAEGVDVRVLADVVSKRLKIPIIYDESIANKKVIIRVPVDLPESALMGILQSALKMKQLALIDGEQPGWKQIVAATNMAGIAKPVGPPGAEPAGAATPVVQVIPLQHADPTKVADAMRPFISLGGSASVVNGQRAIIVSDYGPVALKVEQIARALDDAAPVDVKFIPIKNAEPQQVVTTVLAILAGRDGGTPAASSSGITLTPDERTGQVILIAPKARVQEVTDLIAGVDKPLDLATKVYRLKSASPDRIDKLVKNLIGVSASKRSYQSTIDREAQILVVSATDDIHKRIETLVKELDTPVIESQSPVKFYKLKNAKAADVLATIAGLMGESATVSRPAGADESSGFGKSLLGAPNTPTDNRLPASGAGGMLRGSDTTIAPGSPLAGGRRPRADDLGPLSDVSPRSSMTGGSAGGGMSGSTPENSMGTMRAGGSPEAQGEEAGLGSRAKNATVTADVNTNSIIVIAPPAVQDLYAGLISKLDQRRPQVQIECTIITLDTTNNFSFGVDIGKGGGFGSNNSIISFGSFGIASVDPATGRLTPVRSPGGTFAMLSPGIADVVVRALSSNSHARLISAPQLLVNDNGKGKLESVNQEPFAEILDTSTTQSRTGLGGLAQAGTTISVEPHISEDDYLQLAYSIELSSFTGAARNGLPPPSQKNSIDSAVTIPDGNTIVVGGLQLKNFRAAMDSLPFIDQIPILNLIIGSRSKATEDLTLFVFIKPVILRDDKFADLKHLSDKAMKDVGLPGQYPSSKPIPIK